MNQQLKWDLRFLELAKHISTWSKDPSTKVGSVIVDNDNRIVSVGFNGFPKGVNDTEERYQNREIKYSLVCHAEINSILFAQRDLCNYTIYTWPFPPCASCGKAIIQSGIIRCVSPPIPEELKQRWQGETDICKIMFCEAGVKMNIIEMEEKRLPLTDVPC